MVADSPSPIAGYTIHTVVALAHAGLIPLEQQQAVQQALAQLAPALSTNAETLTALADKSLPTAIGLGGEHTQGWWSLCEAEIQSWSYHDLSKDRNLQASVHQLQGTLSCQACAEHLAAGALYRRRRVPSSLVSFFLFTEPQPPLSTAHASSLS